MNISSPWNVEHMWILIKMKPISKKVAFERFKNIVNAYQVVVDIEASTIAYEFNRHCLIVMAILPLKESSKSLKLNYFF